DQHLHGGGGVHAGGAGAAAALAHRRAGGGRIVSARRIALIAFAVLLVAPLLPVVPEFWVALLDFTGIAALVALGLVLLTGVGGVTSFGQAAFVGIGAYTRAVLATRWGVSPWLGLPAALIVTGLAALILGAVTVRLSGHYLPLGTIAWGVSAFYVFGNT